MDDFFMIVLAFAVGAIFAVFLAVGASSEVMNDRIKAGYFDHNGKAYRIQEVTP